MGFLIDDAGRWDGDGLNEAWLVGWELNWASGAASFTEKLAGFGRGAVQAGEANLLFLGLLWVRVFWAGLDWLDGEADLVVVLQNFGLLNGLSLIIVVGAASLLLLFILFALVIEVTRVTRLLELFVFLLAVGLFQIFTAFVIDNRVGLVEALDVVGQLVVAHAEFIFAVIVVVSTETALGILVGCRDLDRGFFTIEADSNVTVGDADQVLGVVDSVFLESVLVLFMLTIDLDGEFSILGLNLDAVTVGDHFEGLLLVVDLLQQDGKSWLLTSAVFGQNGIALGQGSLEGHIIEGADLAAVDLAFLAFFGGIVTDDVGEGVNGFLDLSWLDELERLDLGWEAQ